MGSCLSEMKLKKGGRRKDHPETHAGKEEDRGPPGDDLYAAVDFSKKRSSRAPGPHDSSPCPSECVYSVILPLRPPAPPTSEAEEGGADDYVLMQ